MLFGKVIMVLNGIRYSGSPCTTKKSKEKKIYKKINNQPKTKHTQTPKTKIVMRTCIKKIAVSHMQE
jgi:hypothetical protein